MKPLEQRLAIAEACNLSRLAPIEQRTRTGKKDPNGVVLWFMEEHHGGAATWAKVPDFLNDLNACREMEEALSYDQRILYCDLLEKFDQANTERHAWFRITHATAPQRAEAFLKTIGKWKSSPLPPVTPGGTGK